LKVQVEISQISSFVEATGGTRQPIIGTRQIQTVIRLRDGETNLLAGLIKRDETDSLSGVPGLMDVPVLNRIFGRTSIENREQDIILTLTPHIIRIPDITEDDLVTLWVGTEENMRLRGPVKNALGASPFGDGADLGEPSSGGPAGSVTGEAEEAADDEEIVEDEPELEEELDEDEEGDESDRASEEDDDGGGPTVVRLIPSAASYRVGDRIMVEVRMENGSNVGSVPFHLRYNRDVMEFIPPATEGAFLGSDGAGTMLLASDSPGGGELVVGLSRLEGGYGVNGSGTLAVFQFQAINPGDAGFAFVGPPKVMDPRATEQPASFMAAQVRVEP
jgi:general secretion pathway protein D